MPTPAPSSTSASRGDAAYARLKGALLLNRHGSGERLDLAELARDHDVSVTPVREAAIRLLGEGLLTIHGKGGFAVPRFAANDLVDALDLHRELLLVAIGRAARAGPPGGPFDANRSPDREPQSSGDRTDRATFEQIAALGRNALLSWVAHGLNDRLERFRVHEGTVIAQADGEVASIAEHLAAWDLPALRDAVRAYHRKRVNKAAQLLWTADQVRTQPDLA